MSAHHLARVTAVVSLALLASAPMAFAQFAQPQTTTRPIRIGFGGGVVVPRTGGSVNTLKTGVHGQGFVLFQLPGGLPAIRANFDYSKMKFDDAAIAGSTSTSPDANRTELGGVASLKLDLLHGPVRPYLLAGVGAYNVKDVVRQTAQGSTTSYSDTNLGLDGGVGLAFKLWAIEGFAETRLQNVYTKQKGLVDTKSIQAFPVTFGIVF